MLRKPFWEYPLLGRAHDIGIHWAEVALGEKCLNEGTTVHEHHAKDGTLQPEFKISDMLADIMKLYPGAFVFHHYIPSARNNNEIWNIAGPDFAFHLSYQQSQRLASMAIYTTVEALVRETQALAKKYLSRKPPKGRVYVVVAGQEGPYLHPMGQAGETFIPENYRPEVVAGFQHVVKDLNSDDPCGRVIILDGPPGTGKCLGLGTPVIKYDGSVVPVEDVAVGDLLMGPDSKPRSVLSTTRNRGPLYKISPVKGDSWICNDVHVLTLVNSHTGKVVDIALDEYLKKSKCYKSEHKLFSTDVTFTKFQEELPLNPYFLGLWLGDGDKSLEPPNRNNLSVLCRAAITTTDSEIVDFLDAFSKNQGLKLSKYDSHGTRCPTYSITGEHGEHHRGNKNPIVSMLRAVTGSKARIPHQYLTASRESRLQLLAGLIDSDGSLSDGGFEWSQKDPKLTQDVAFLVRSLGFRVTNAPCFKSCQNGATGFYQRLFISGDCSVIPTKISRKKAPVRKQVKNVLRTGFAVESIGEGEYAGFTLDGDGRFLLGDFTVTHNTHAVRALLNEVPNGTFVLIPSNAISSLGSPGFIKVLLREQRPGRPLILVIEDADEALATRKGGNMSEISSLLNFSDGIFGSVLDIRIVATTNAEIQELDDAVLRPGRLCQRIEVGKLDHTMAESAYIRLGGKEAGLFTAGNFYTLGEIYKMARGGDTSEVVIKKPKSRLGFRAEQDEPPKVKSDLQAGDVVTMPDGRVVEVSESGAKNTVIRSWEDMKKALDIDDDDDDDDDSDLIDEDPDDESTPKAMEDDND